MAANGKEKRVRAAATTAVTKLSGAPQQWGRWLRFTKEAWQALLASDPFWIVLFLVVSTWALVPSGSGWQATQVDVGTIANRDFVAPRDALVPDQETTQGKRDKARQDVLPVYDLDPAEATRLTAELDKAFTEGRSLLAPPPEIQGEEVKKGPAKRDNKRQSEPSLPQPEPPTDEAMLAAIQTASGLKLDQEQVHYFASRSFSQGLEDHLQNAFEQTLSTGVVAGKTVLLENRSRGIRVRNLQTGLEKRQLDLFAYLDFPDEAREHVASQVRSWGSSDAAHRTLLTNFIVSNLSPNLHLNQSETVRRQKAAAAAIEQVYNRVRKGQVIVRKGDQIDAQAARLIRDLAGEQGVRARLLPALGIFLFLALLVLVMWLGIRKGRVAESRRTTVLGESLLLLLVALLSAKLCHLLATGLANAAVTPPFNAPQVYFYAIPFAALALVTVLLYGRGLAMLMALSFSVLTGLVLEESSWTFLVFAMAGSMAAILAIDHFHFKQRSLMVRGGAIVGAVNGVTVLMLAAIAGGGEGGSVLALRVLCGLVGGILVAAAASFAVPVLESLFSVTTGIKLVELANTNLPLLRRLAFEAPGTFQHSLMVANLAKAGCEAIEADSVLAYTGALYHDVGKIFRPEYFIENQRPGHNRHDKLLPSMSTLILINHVKEGLELAREHHLPEPILDAIGEHHGTRLISYFFNKAKEMHDPESGELAEEKFRYPGPRPQNKVMGVLMLADGVEAASRSLEAPSPARIRSVIKMITDDCLADGQLDDTDLTLGDLKRVAEAFQRVLAHIHHRRVDYPGFDFNGRKGGKPPAEASLPPSPEGSVPSTPESATHDGEVVHQA